MDRLAASMELRRWVIGFDFAFGRGRTGNAEWLRGHGHEVEVIPPFNSDGPELHSSEIRRLVRAGDMDEADRFLRRDYSMSGPVEAGDHLGRHVGVPTATI